MDALHFFVDFKAAWKLKLDNISSAVRIARDSGKTFDTKQAFREIDFLLCDFNLLMEKIMPAVKLNIEGTIFYMSVQLLA